MVRSAATVRTAASVLVALLAVAGVVGPVTAGAAAGTAAPQPIDGCTTITEPGRYVLSENTTFKSAPTSGTCLVVNADDVVIDGQGYVFAGHGTSNTTGIRIVGAKNVTVRNVIVKDWHRGIYVRNASGAAVMDASVRSNAYGLYLRDTDSTTVTNTDARGNLVGVRSKGDGDTTFENFESINNRLGAARDARKGDTVMLDQDGNLRFEDIDGDGESDYADAISLFGLATEHTFGLGGLSVSHRNALDFNGNGKFGYGDFFSYIG